MWPKDDRVKVRVRVRVGLYNDLTSPMWPWFPEIMMIS